MGNKQTDKEWNDYRQNISQGWSHVPHPTNIENEITNTNTQTNKIQWTENKLWTVSSIFFITLLLLAWFYPMIVLSMCVITLCAMLLYVTIWLGTILLKEILGLDDE